MEQLGIDPKLLGAQIVNFLVIVFILNKLLYKPILTLLEKRRREIAEGVAFTEKMRKEEEKLALRREKALGKAREEALAIISEAKRQAKEVEKDILAQAHAQGGTIVERAKEEVETIKKEAQAGLRREAVSLAVQMAKRLLSSILTVRDQHQLIAKNVKELEQWVLHEASKS